MTLLRACGVALRHPSDPVFLLQTANFGIRAGDRIGLVGPNGAGKTTLLRLLVGEVEPSAGEIVRRRDLSIAYVRQELAVPSSLPLTDYLFGARPDLANLRRDLALFDERNADPQAALQYVERLDEYAAAGGYELEAEIERVLDGMRFTSVERDMPVGQLSSGQRTRAELARLLLIPADVLLLDEPTNHLDWEALGWLERYLTDLPAACIVVSHDRHFLSRTVRGIWELKAGMLTMYEGGYDYYREQRALMQRQAWEAYEAQQRRAKAAREAAERRDRLAQQVGTMPKGLGNQVAKPFYRAKAARIARTARLLRERPLREAEAVKPRVDSPIPTLDFLAVPRAGEIVLQVRDLAKVQADRPLFEGVSFELARGERLAIVGPNGAGKTMLLRLLLGKLTPDAGTMAWGANVDVGYFAQEGENLPADRKPLDICRHSGLDDRWVRTILACLKLGAELVERPVSRLSAGERGKVALARLILSGANVLVLDEPTNHLDIEAREALEGTLQQFPGTIVFVSHDRYFVDTLADRVLELGAD